METMEEKRKRPRRSFSDEYKAEVVELCRSSDKTIAEVAGDLCLTVSAVRRWVAQADIDAGRRPGMTSEEHAELVQLRKENRVLREERDILKRDSFLRQGDPVNVYPFIEAEKAEQDDNVAMTCVLLEVSRSAYYEWSKHVPCVREVADAELGDKIVDIHTKSRGTYGAPRITAELAESGICVGQKRVARLMVRRGLIERCKRRFKVTTTPDPDATSLAADLIKRAFSPQSYELNTAWCGDITYIRTWEGWLYLATVIDLASRRVVGFAMADHMPAELVCDAMEMALAQRRPAAGLIFHADRGSQYTSEKFRQLLSHHHVVQSLSRPGQCWDYAVAESCFATLKEELIYRQGWPTRIMARRAIFEFIEVFYNRQRRHSSLDNLTPSAYEQRRRKDSAHNDTQAA